MDLYRNVAIKTEKGVFMCAMPDGMSEPADIFLDLWQAYLSSNIRAMYGDDAVIYDSATGRVYTMAESAPVGNDKYIGYRFMSKFRTLPTPKQDLAPSRIARAKFRFLESVPPYIKGHPSGLTDRIIMLDESRFIDGVADVPVPGNVERDAAFEVFTDEPDPLSVICFYSEEE
jgi:hypothetical protein